MWRPEPSHMPSPIGFMPARMPSGRSACEECSPGPHRVRASSRVDDVRVGVVQTIAQQPAEFSQVAGRRGVFEILTAVIVVTHEGIAGRNAGISHYGIAELRCQEGKTSIVRPTSLQLLKH